MTKPAPKKKAAPKAATPDIRKQLEAVMRATLADETTNHDWTYLAARPCAMPTTGRKYVPGSKVVGDCSKGVQFLSWWVPGCVDPMGNGFGTGGNSYTLWLNLQHLDSPSDLLVGDVVTFGPDGDEHAAMVLEAGVDPLLWSFGHQGAPNTYRLSQDGRVAQYLRLPVPKYVPTPQDKLRARTGWFAWVAWRLGEGDWKPYGKSAKKVRPSVPKVIPPSWWLRYAVYIKNRKKGNKPTTG